MHIPSKILEHVIKQRVVSTRRQHKSTKTSHTRLVWFPLLMRLLIWWTRRLAGDVISTRLWTKCSLIYYTHDYNYKGSFKRKKAKIHLPKPTHQVVYDLLLPALPYVYVLPSSLLWRQFVSWGMAVQAFYQLSMVADGGLEDSEVW